MFDSQSLHPFLMLEILKKLKGNNFYTWLMKMEFLLHEKDLWEITSRELLLLKIEFGEIVLEEDILE
jgi:hypothetical protein